MHLEDYLPEAYMKNIKWKEIFPSKYRALLNATTVMSVEDLQNRQILIWKIHNFGERA